MRGRSHNLLNRSVLIVTDQFIFKLYSISFVLQSMFRYNPGMSRISYREQVLKVREDVIVDVVNRLLATKGYDLMTVDEVAAEAGMAKASLYKHFPSKEDLAGAAMVRILERTLAQVEVQRQQAGTAPVDQLKTLVRWTLEVQLAGEMPALPSQNSRLTSALRDNKLYMDRFVLLTDRLGEWITDAQSGGSIDSALPPELVLYTLFARACDPVLRLMKSGGMYRDEQLVEWLVSTTFAGLSGRSPTR